ncbi:hypothetical protein [Amycolatopsis sp. NPDC051903]|uniref:hypothetical protein n=1 Tax=Amycolatopsis sp. NPDC051903 TaxID=3363936 RepID=UPI003794A531
MCTAAGLTITIDAAGNTPAQGIVPIPPTVPPRADGRVRGLDDYDTWCENGSVCDRTISDNIGETKGNAAYGNSSGAIGSFDVVLRTNLNGRQAQWRVTSIHDTGPSLQFSDAQVNCWEEVNLSPDNSCGVYGAGSPAVSARWDSGILYSNRLNHSNEYYGAVNGSFTPAGYPAYPLGTLEGAYFNCSAKRQLLLSVTHRRIDQTPDQ